MPEYSEVRLTSQFVTSKNKNRKIVDVEYLPSNKLKLIENMNVIGSQMSGKSRGKELQLVFGSNPVTITLGMSGSFRVFKERGNENEKTWKHSHIRFKMSDGEWFTWYDVRRFGKSVGTDWSYNKRGPDMFDDTQNFIDNILSNINHKDFDKPAYEVLMNQKWFNGVGNYLRAEILGKWGKTPFQPMRNLISEEFLHHLLQQVTDSYRMGGGKLYTWMLEDSIDTTSNIEWDTWMQYYGKGVNIKDKQGRTFWFDKKWASL
jgi:endonuclease VIII-like 1